MTMMEKMDDMMEMIEFFKENKNRLSKLKDEVKE